MRHRFDQGVCELGALGECEVAFVARCSFLGREDPRGVGCMGLKGRSFFKPMQEVLHHFLKGARLQLPKLAEVQEEYARTSQLDPTRLAPKKGAAKDSGTKHRDEPPAKRTRR